MSTTSAYAAIAVLKKSCSAAQKWTFLVTDDFQTIANYKNGLDDLVRYSLFLRNNGPWSVKDFAAKCQKLASPEESKTLKGLFQTFYKENYNCELYPELADQSFEQCGENIERRDGKCLCTIDETDQDPYSVIEI